MYQQLWGYKVEEKLYVGVREQKRLNTADLTCTQREVDLWKHVFVSLLQLSAFVGRGS
jgi:hypothetical protein